MSVNPECPSCPIGNDEDMFFFAGRVARVFISDIISSDPEGTITEQEVRQKEITPEDIDRLTPNLEADIDLSMGGCFTTLHETARTDQELLAALTDEQKIAIAACAKRRLHLTCEL